MREMTGPTPTLEFGRASEYRHLSLAGAEAALGHSAASGCYMGTEIEKCKMYSEKPCIQ